MLKWENSTAPYIFAEVVVPMAEYIFKESLCTGKPAFDRIAMLQNYIINCSDNKVVLRIHSKGRVGLTFVFLLATLWLTASNANKQFQLFLNPKFHQLYRRIQLGDGGKNRGPGFHRIRSNADIIRLVTKITSQAPVELDERVSEILVSKIGEMFINAFDHANANNIIGGKYFKHQKRFCFACYDDGIGLVNSVKNFFAYIRQEIPDDLEALRWAMQDGNTTKMLNTTVPRGLGMTTLMNFAKANDGAVRICSGHALYIFNTTGEHYYRLDHAFQGTLIEMDIIADNTHRYILKD